MAVVASDAAGLLRSFVKGSPEVLLQLSSRGLVGKRAAARVRGQAAPSRPARRLGEGGHRVLAWLSRPRPVGSPEAAERDLTWVGDRPDRPAPAGVREAIETLRGAGIRTVMVTGDQKGTALAVARELAILGPHDRCLTSEELTGYVRERRWVACVVPLSSPASRPKTS